jgi:hypothetical protein
LTGVVRGGPRGGSLSVCRIVRNEAANVAAAVESVRAVADEIVVGDTGSRRAKAS